MHLVYLEDASFSWKGSEQSVHSSLQNLFTNPAISTFCYCWIVGLSLNTDRKY